MKKYCSIVLTLLFLVLVFLFPVSADYLPGDVNGDGQVEPEDARLTLRASVKLENYAEGSAQFLAADVNRDGKIGSDDARKILRVSVKLETF